MASSSDLERKRSVQALNSYSVPGEWKCNLCGGATCKYEPAQWERWTENGRVVQALTGLYSSWITADIIAMARPSQRAFFTHDLVSQFLGANVRAVINCQQRGEHAKCGEGVLSHCGFSYDPELLMRNGIYFYNFSWKDMTTPKMELMLEIVQVIAFTVSKGGKIAIHCHAGLGRTGLCIASYLLFAGHAQTSEEAIGMVRKARPGSVQTKKQEQFARDFHRFVKGLQQIYPPPSSAGHKTTLAQLLKSQAKLLHGFERRRLKSLPKVIDALCWQLEHKFHSSALLALHIMANVHMINFYGEIADGDDAMIRRYTDNGVVSHDWDPVVLDSRAQNQNLLPQLQLLHQQRHPSQLGQIPQQTMTPYLRETMIKEQINHSVYHDYLAVEPSAFMIWKLLIDFLHVLKTPIVSFTELRKHWKSHGGHAHSSSHPQWGSHHPHPPPPQQQQHPQQQHGAEGGLFHAYRLMIKHMEPPNKIILYRLIQASRNMHVPALCNYSFLLNGLFQSDTFLKKNTSSADLEEAIHMMIDFWTFASSEDWSNILDRTVLYSLETPSEEEGGLCLIPAAPAPASTSAAPVPQ